MNPRNVEDVIKDFKDRRAGIMRALTKDVEDLYKLCDPSNPNLCLYGYPNQQWEVNLPPPSDLPEPRLGINFARDTMSKQEWLSMVALHSDAWLYAVASYFASKLYFDKADKKRLFNKISDVPSLLEAVGRGNARIRKRAKMEGGGIPEHILDEEVLSRVPVRDLLKYRSVCKMWLCLIDGPNFVSAHLKNFKTNSEATHLLVMYRARGWADEQILVRRADTFRKVHQLKNTYASHHVVSYVNGVILVKVGNYRSFPQIVLWNPSIDKSVDVPADSMIFGAMEDATYFELGFGYDASYNDYKVVAIVYPHAEIRYTYGVRYRATVPGLLQVYTLTKNFWTSNIAVSPPPYWTVGPQVYLNGAIHWINFGPNVADDSWYKTKDSYVVLFDIEIEVFKYFELPTRMKTDDEPRENFPTVLGRSFAIFCSYNEARHDIWLMTEYGVANSWTKVYTFTLHLDKLLHFNVNGELLFAVQGKGIKSYDVHNKRVKDLAKTYSKSSNYTVFTYVESLLLFKQGQITQSQSQ